MEDIPKKKINLKPIIAILTMLIVIIGATMAYFVSTDTFSNIFHASSYSAQVKEVFESPNDWKPGDTTPKTITAKNTGSVCEHVRLSYTENWVSDNDSALPLKQNGNSAAIINLANTSDWIKNGNYYYYNKDLLSGQTTPTFMESVTFNPAIQNDYTCTKVGGKSTCSSTRNGYDNGHYTLTITVETIQCDASEDAWDVDVTSLNNNHAMLDTGQVVNGKWKTLAAGGTSTSYSAADSTITEIKRARKLPAEISAAVSTTSNKGKKAKVSTLSSNYEVKKVATLGTDYAIISTSTSTIPIYSWYDDGTIYYYSEAGIIELNPNSSHLFFELRSLTSIGDFETEDTSKVTTMSKMFSSAGNSTTTWNIGDLSGWDVSKVTDMSSMFMYVGESASTFSLDLSSWDTSSVTNMSSMFYNAGYNATTWSIGDLSSWNTSNVTNMSNMFSSAGRMATTWSIGDLSSWNTSSVTNMLGMFSLAGYSASTFSLDLSSWNTSKVTSMTSMFYGAGRNATTWSIGDLSGWNTSSVTNMSKMFSAAGRNATTWNIGDLSGWNTSSVTNMSNMFEYAGRMATTWQSIGTLKVYATNIYRMFYDCPKAKATLNIYSNPASGTSGYNQAFTSAATASGALITVNYASTTTNIDNIIATKSSTSNVVKGSVLS